MRIVTHRAVLFNAAGFMPCRRRKNRPNLSLFGLEGHTWRILLFLKEKCAEYPAGCGILKGRDRTAA
jgi:hypothetical protein